MNPPDPPSPADRPSASRGRALFTVAVLVGLLALTAGVMGWAWTEIGEVEFTTHGLIALGLGVGLTFLCGAGLMALVFYSSRRGYDERAHDWSRDRSQRERRD